MLKSDKKLKRMVCPAEGFAVCWVIILNKHKTNQFRVIRRPKHMHWILTLTKTSSFLLTVSPAIFVYVSLNICIWKTAETSTWTSPALLGKIGTVTDLASLGGITIIPIRASLSSAAKEQKSVPLFRYTFTWWRDNERSIV